MIEHFWNTKLHNIADAQFQAFNTLSC